HTGHPLDCSDRVLPEHVAHPAAGCGHGHVDVDQPVAVVVDDLLTAVDEAELHDRHRYLGVVHGVQGGSDLVHRERSVPGDGHPAFRGELDPQRVGVVAVDPHERAHLGADGVAAT